MSNDDNLNRWNFQTEIQKLATACSKVKGDTARYKAALFFDKWRGNIESTSDIQHYNKLRKAFNALKSGNIRFSMANNTDVEIKISDVMEFYSSKDTIKIVLSNGKDFSFDPNYFDYLNLIFKS